MTKEVIHGRKIKIELTYIAWCEGSDFQFDDDVATEFQVIEKKIKRVVFTADFQRYLSTDKGKAGAQLQEELLDMVHKRLLHLGFAARIGSAQKVEKVRILKRRFPQPLIR